MNGGTWSELGNEKQNEGNDEANGSAHTRRCKDATPFKRHYS